MVPRPPIPIPGVNVKVPFWGKTYEKNMFFRLFFYFYENSKKERKILRRVAFVVQIQSIQIIEKTKFAHINSEITFVFSDYFKKVRIFEISKV